MSDFGTAQQIDTDPIGAALTATQQALFSLRIVNHRQARRLTTEYEQIANQHTTGLLTKADTIHALAGLVARAGQQQAS